MAETVSNFEDLTEAGSPDGAEKPANKPARPQRPPRPPMAIAPAPDYRTNGKKKKGGKLKIILIIVFAVLVAGFIFEELYFNYLGTRDIFITAVMKLDPDLKTREEELKEWETELDARENALTTRERSAQSRETQNEKRKEELDARESEIFEQSQWMAPLYKREMTEQEILDMQALSSTYSMMSPESAAAILMELVQADDVAAILYFMNARNSAAILASMDPEFAAIITEILLYK